MVEILISLQVIPTTDCNARVDDGLGKIFCLSNIFSIHPQYTHAPPISQPNVTWCVNTRNTTHMHSLLPEKLMSKKFNSDGPIQ